MNATPSNDSHIFATLLLLNRAALGLLFMLAGIRKLLLPDGLDDLAANLRTFAGYVASKAPLPQPVGMTYGYALPFVEIVAGLMLVLAVRARLAAGLIALLLLSFIIALGINWWPAKGPPFDLNVVLLALSLLLAYVGPGRFSLDRAFSRQSRARSR